MYTLSRPVQKTICSNVQSSIKTTSSCSIKDILCVSSSALGNAPLGKAVLGNARARPAGKGSSLRILPPCSVTVVYTITSSQDVWNVSGYQVVRVCQIMRVSVLRPNVFVQYPYQINNKRDSSDRGRHVLPTRMQGSCGYLGGKICSEKWSFVSRVEECRRS